MKERCGTCRFRNDTGVCTNPKLREPMGGPKEGENWDDYLVYSYDEGGSFHVGPMFGCVHWKARE